jgi:hypothetical protein
MKTEEVIQLILDNDYSEFNMVVRERGSDAKYVTICGRKSFSFEVKRGLLASEMTLTISRRLKRCLIAEKEKILRAMHRLDLLEEKGRIIAELEEYADRTTAPNIQEEDSEETKNAGRVHEDGLD